VPAGDAPWPVIKVDGVKAKNVGDSCVITFDEGVFASFVSLSDVAVKQLTKLADVLRPGIGKYKIEVEGHTDDRPLRNTSVYNGNDALALARGQAVEKFLTGVGKLPESAVSVLHAGTHAAPYPNNSAVNRRRNRTVVIRLVRP
jgi:flagellar motor protein MotB